MITIDNIRIRVQTASGVYHSEFSFLQGFNLIRGDNTSGKSTMFQAIMYCLGAEELLGARGAQTMQSALRDQVIGRDDDLHTVIQSYVDLVLTNNDKKILIRRFVLGNNRSDKLIEIFERVDEDYKPIGAAINTWIHDKGGASNVKHGFHSYLSRFIGFNLPDVYYSNAEYKQLYIQTIFPGFIIEQKRGWTDYLATIPYFGVRDAKNRVVEFILGLDSYKNEELKIKVSNDLKDVKTSWTQIIRELKDITSENQIRLFGIPDSPEILESERFYDIRIIDPNNNLDNSEIEVLIAELTAQYESIKVDDIETVGERAPQNERLIKELQLEIDQKSLQYDLEVRNLRLIVSKEDEYNRLLEEILQELDQNRDAKKLNSLGAQQNLEVALQICPTCSQSIKDSLLPDDVEHIPMAIDENIKYLISQKKMILAYLSKHKRDVDMLRTSSSALYNQVRDLRSNIRLLKQELTKNENLPSLSQIEKKIRLKIRIEGLYEVIEKIDLKVERLRTLSERFKNNKIEKSKLPKDYLSAEDTMKLDYFEKEFKRLLRRFGYRSKSMLNFSISRSSYLPVAIEGRNVYDIKYDSSASDLVRSIWAYSCGLYLTSIKFDGNHPGFLMFDEPAQQSMANLDFKEFFKELESYQDGQTLLFASFNNSEEEFRDSVSVVKKFNYKRINNRLLNL